MSKPRVCMSMGALAVCAALLCAQTAMAQCPTCVTDDDCAAGQSCQSGFCAPSPPGCNTNNPGTGITPIFNAPVTVGDEVCFRVTVENLGDDNCDVEGFTANLYMPDCMGSPGCVGGTVIPITVSACLEQNASFQCPGPDPRCATAGTCSIGTGYSYIVQSEDEIGPLLPGFCPPTPSGQVYPRNVTAFVIGSGITLLALPAPGASCQVGLVPITKQCDINVDKQISCDGGVTWVDAGFEDGTIESCIGWNAYDGMPAEPIMVRYIAQGSSDDNVDLVNCQLTDSNTGIIGAPVGIPNIPIMPGDIIFQTSVDCSEALDDGEPDTATLTCDCAVEGFVFADRTDSDQASFDCQTPDLTVVKECAACDDNGDNAITITVTNSGDAELAGCSATDVIYLDDPMCPGEGMETNIPLMGAGFDPSNFTLAPGQSRTLTGVISALAADAANEALVTCDIVGADKQITADNCDVCVACLCGDDMVNQPGEYCDGPDQAPGVMCTEPCRAPGAADPCTCCGDNVLQPGSGETCDPPGAPSGPSGNPCRDDCTFCGDGIVDPGDECDDGNNIEDDGCNNMCMLADCGDDMINQPEEYCDGPAEAPGVMCTEPCRAPDSPDECTCCGDNVLQPGSGETCDPPGAPSGMYGNDCRMDCTVCGDNILDMGEECDGTADGACPGQCQNDCTCAGGGEGCTPGYWKLLEAGPSEAHHECNWTVYSPGDDYETVFGVTTTASFKAETLIEALEQGGGGEKALGRHATAALLNATNPCVSYSYSAAQIIAMVQEAYATGDFNGIKSLLAFENETYCPLGNCNDGPAECDKDGGAPRSDDTALGSDSPSLTGPSNCGAVKMVSMLVLAVGLVGLRFVTRRKK